MAGSFVLFGKAFVGSTRLAGRAGIVQRISIGTRVRMADSSLAAGAASLLRTAEPRKRGRNVLGGARTALHRTADTERPRHALIGRSDRLTNPERSIGSTEVLPPPAPIEKVRAACSAVEHRLAVPHSGSSTARRTRPGGWCTGTRA
jgi:hypothetical protein